MKNETARNGNGNDGSIIPVVLLIVVLMMILWVFIGENESTQFIDTRSIQINQ